MLLSPQHDDGFSPCRQCLLFSPGNLCRFRCLLIISSSIMSQYSIKIKIPRFSARSASMPRHRASSVFRRSYFRSLCWNILELRRRYGTISAIADARKGRNSADKLISDQLRWTVPLRHRSIRWQISVALKNCWQFLRAISFILYTLLSVLRPSVALCLYFATMLYA